MVNATDQLIEEERSYVKNWRYWMRIKNSILRQKARLRLMIEGDENTNFFHASVKQRVAINRIVKLFGEDDQFIEGADNIEQEILRFYKGLLGSSFETMAVSSRVVRKGPMLSGLEARFLIGPVTNSEIELALHAMDNHKAPGHDGWNAYFFKKVRLIVKEDMCLVIKQFFEYVHMPEYINHTLITRIPKTTNADRVSLFRPISCCTVMYKVLSHRMNLVVGNVVDRAQFGFIPGRQLGDNVLLVGEFIKGYEGNI